MADGKIYIIVTDQLPGGTTDIPEDEPNKKEEKKKESTLAQFAQHKFFNLIESQAKQAVSYSINNIGNFTGNYETQQQMSETMQIVSSLIDIGTAAVAGAKFGPWGAVIAAGVVVIGKGVSAIQGYYAGEVENRRQNYAIAQLRSRAGLNSTNNGSRGTEY